MTLMISQAGYYLVMYNAQSALKEKMKLKVLQSIKDEELTVISLDDHKDKIYWEDDEQNEFSYNGEMYDLVKKKVIDGKIFLYSINDKQEQRLIDKYNSIAKNNAEDKKAKGFTGASLTLFFSQDSNTKSISFQIPYHYISFVSELSKGITCNTSPPPKA